MTPERLAEIQARVDAATPGPWVADVDVRGDCVVWGPGGQFLANAQAEPHWVPWPDRNELRTVAFDADRRDVEFIARARQDVVDLLAEVKRLSAARTQDAARYVASTPSAPVGFTVMVKSERTRYREVVGTVHDDRKIAEGRRAWCQSQAERDFDHPNEYVLVEVREVSE